MPFIGGEVELGRWRLQSRRLWLRPLGVNTNSGKLVAEATAALKLQQRGRLGRREGCSEVGLGGGQHGVASAGDATPRAGGDRRRRRCAGVNGGQPVSWRERACGISAPRGVWASVRAGRSREQGGGGLRGERLRSGRVRAGGLGVVVCGQGRCTIAAEQRSVARDREGRCVREAWCGGPGARAGGGGRPGQRAVCARPAAFARRGRRAGACVRGRSEARAGAGSKGRRARVEGVAGWSRRQRGPGQVRSAAKKGRREKRRRKEKKMGRRKEKKKKKEGRERKKEREREIRAEITASIAEPIGRVPRSPA